MACSATDVNNQYFVSVTARKVQFKKLLSAPTGSKADTVETAATVPDKAIRATFNKNTRDKITQALEKNCTHTRVPDIQPHGEAHDSAMVFQARRIRHHQDRRRTERPQPRCYRGRRRRGNDHHSQLEKERAQFCFPANEPMGGYNPHSNRREGSSQDHRMDESDRTGSIRRHRSQRSQEQRHLDLGRRRRPHQDHRYEV